MRRGPSPKYDRSEFTRLCRELPTYTAAGAVLGMSAAVARNLAAKLRAAGWDIPERSAGHPRKAAVSEETP